MWLDAEGDNSWADGGGYSGGYDYTPPPVSVPAGSATVADSNNGWGPWLQQVTSRIVDAELFRRTYNSPGAVPPGYIMTRDGRLVRAGQPALQFGGTSLMPLLAVGVVAILLLRKG